MNVVTVVVAIVSVLGVGGVSGVSTWMIMGWLEKRKQKKIDEEKFREEAALCMENCIKYFGNSGKTIRTKKEIGGYRSAIDKSMADFETLIHYYYKKSLKVVPINKAFINFNTLHNRIKGAGSDIDKIHNLLNTQLQLLQYELAIGFIRENGKSKLHMMASRKFKRKNRAVGGRLEDHVTMEEYAAKLIKKGYHVPAMS